MKTKKTGQHDVVPKHVHYYSSLVVERIIVLMRILYAATTFDTYTRLPIHIGRCTSINASPIKRITRPRSPPARNLLRSICCMCLVAYHDRTDTLTVRIAHTRNVIDKGIPARKLMTSAASEKTVYVHMYIRKSFRYCIRGMYFILSSRMVNKRYCFFCVKK